MLARRGLRTLQAVTRACRAASGSRCVGSSNSSRVGMPQRFAARERAAKGRPVAAAFVNTTSAERLLSMLAGTEADADVDAESLDHLEDFDEPFPYPTLEVKTMDEELVAYLCLQKIMQVYEDDHFEPEEKIAQLLSDSMNVVPGLHHTVSKRLGRFINLRGQDSIRARVRFRKDMRKLLASNLACPDYLIFLLERLWHSSHWNHDDVLVHEAQANLQSIWIPELKTLFKVVKWENEHYQGQRASVDELIHRVVVAHKFISGRLPRRAQLGLYHKLLRHHSLQLRLYKQSAKPKSNRRQAQHKRQKRKKEKQTTSVLEALGPVLQTQRYAKVRPALEWIFGTIGDMAAEPSVDMRFDRLTPIAKLLVRIKRYLDKFDDSATIAKEYESGEWSVYEGSDVAVGPSANGSGDRPKPFLIPSVDSHAAHVDKMVKKDNSIIHNVATGQTLSRYSSAMVGSLSTDGNTNPGASAQEDQSWVFQCRHHNGPLYTGDIYGATLHKDHPHFHLKREDRLLQSMKEMEQSFRSDKRVALPSHAEETQRHMEEVELQIVERMDGVTTDALHIDEQSNEIEENADGFSHLYTYINPHNSVIVSNLRADFTEADLQVAFGSRWRIKSAHVFGNRIFSVPLLSKEEIALHIGWEQANSTPDEAVAPMSSAPTAQYIPKSESQRDAMSLGAADLDQTSLQRPQTTRRRKRGRPKKKKEPTRTLADSLLELEKEKMHRVFGLVEFEDPEATDAMCCEALTLFGAYVNGRMCPVINRADAAYSIIVHNISLAIARCEVDRNLNSILPLPLRIEIMKSCSYNWFETQKSVRIKYPTFLHALAAKTVLDGSVLKGRQLAVDWDTSVPTS